MCQEGGEPPPKGKQCNILLPAESCHLPGNICTWSIDGLVVSGKGLHAKNISLSNPGKFLYMITYEWQKPKKKMA